MKEKRITTNLNVLLIRFAIGLAVLFLIMVILKICFFASSNNKIGLVIPGSINEPGWCSAHYEGISKAAQSLGFELIVKEKVPENDPSGLHLSWLIREGVKTIFLAGNNYSKVNIDLIREHPEIQFYDISTQLHEKNLSFYFLKMYQARYLAGIIAGMKTVSSQIGYIAAYDNPEVNRGLAAFTLGVHSVNPKAVVNAYYTNSWQETPEAINFAERIISLKRTDVMACHLVTFKDLEKVTENYGIFFIGNQYMIDDASDKMLTSVKGDWTEVYKKILSREQNGKLDTKSFYWTGLENDSVGLTPFSAMVDTAIVEQLNRAENRILNGHDVFTCPLVDSHGTTVCPEGAKIPDKTLLENFDWLPNGVKIYR